MNVRLWGHGSRPPVRYAQTPGHTRPVCRGLKVTLTSTGVSELRSPKETKVASPRPNGLRVSKTQPGTEVVSVECLFPVDRVVAGGVVGAAHPDLAGPRGQECWHVTNAGHRFCHETPTG